MAKNWNIWRCFGNIQKPCISTLWSSNNNLNAYKVSSIKDLEHLRRTKRSSVTVTFTPNSPLLVGKEALLSNKENKQLFLKMLGDYLEAAGHTIFYAESDADTLIVRTALTLAERKHVTVVADDTDILVLLLYHNQRDTIMQSATCPGKTRDIKSMQHAVGEAGCKVILFSHALTGCDTTSALFGKSKSAAFRHFIKYNNVNDCATFFGLEMVDKNNW